MKSLFVFVILLITCTANSQTNFILGTKTAALHNFPAQPVVKQPDVSDAGPQKNRIWFINPNMEYSGGVSFRFVLSKIIELESGIFNQDILSGGFRK